MKADRAIAKFTSRNRRRTPAETTRTRRYALYLRLILRISTMPEESLKEFGGRREAWSLQAQQIARVLGRHYEVDVVNVTKVVAVARNVGVRLSVVMTEKMPWQKARPGTNTWQSERRHHLEERRVTGYC